MAKKKTLSSEQVARAIRADAHYAEVFNSGLEVWLYDASHRGTLKASRVFEVDAEDSAFEQQMLGFLKRGLIAAYQLEQDDSLSVAVAVGEPLTSKELGVARWLEPQKAYLRLPSGRLIIESNDALTLRETPPTDAGAELAVPAGDYLMTLYRIDDDALEADGIEWHGPNQFMVLTPGAAAKPVRDAPVFLAWTPRGPGEASWTVEPGEYRGMALAHDADTTISVALDRTGGAKLGLADLALLALSVPALGIDSTLVYLEGNAEGFEFFARLDKVKRPREHAKGEWAHCWFQPGLDRLFGMRVDGKIRVPKKLQETWHPATLRLLAGRALEKKTKG